ncbi:hypothetical protein SH661x_001071 [Planctomicrobium sp. SH661]|uniref:hypothetical protein n=1 Tax=Planctomicrobium sp. SH661 TaxID=3448124 RepID=UPI003F5C1700
MIETGLRTWLLANAPVHSLTGSGTDPVFIDDAPPNSREYFLISLIDGDYANTVDANDPTHRDLVDEEIDLDVKAETIGRAKAAGKDILDTLFPEEGDNFTGVMGDRQVDAIYLEGVKAGYEQPLNGETKGRHVYQITLRIHSRSA